MKLYQFKIIINNIAATKFIFIIYSQEPEFVRFKSISCSRNDKRAESYMNCMVETNCYDYLRLTRPVSPFSLGKRKRRQLFVLPPG